MKVKVGDNVLILAGKDKGKEGKVIRTIKKDSKVVVEGINIVKKHSKPTNTNDKGGIFDIEAPIHVSNVKVISAEVAKTKKAATKTAEKKEEVKMPKAKAESTAKKTSKKASK